VQLRKNGFNNARDFVEDTIASYDSIYAAGDGALFVVKYGDKNQLVIVKREKQNSSEYYDVKTGYICRPDFLKNKQKLWEKLQDGEGRSPTSQRPPSAVTGHPDTSLSAIPDKTSSPAPSGN
jgi:hypothetical protein